MFVCCRRVLLLFCGILPFANGFLRTRGLIPDNEDKNLTLENYIRPDGYPLEIHHVTTEDGYILTLHRIPLSNTNLNADGSRRVVLAMHGLLGCSADWVLSRNRSLAYILSNNGYDVWLGNSRGSTYSKNHTKLDIGSAEFWDFSWHEMGLYDLPAIIDYILDQTGEKKLFYVGFSQGTTQFWVLMSLRPEYNEKIKLMSALAPVAYTGHIQGLLKYLSFFGNLFKIFYKFTGFFEVLSNTFIMKRVLSNICKEDAITQPLCEMTMYLIGGFSNGEYDRANMGNIMQFVPAGSSFKQLIHYAMGIQNPGHFRPYDNGFLSNIRTYRRIVPPEYPVEKITSPVILYVGLNDWLAHPKDVEILNKKLPNVVEKYTVTLKRLNHFDFLYGLDVPNLVYKHVLQRMNSIL